MNEHGTEGEFYPAKTLEEFVDSLVKPRTAIIMVKAGEPTDAMINALADLMEPGDIIVDAGNAYFPDTIRREKEISARGLHFVGCGVSGGEEGALLGPSMMPGGSEESWKTLKPIFESIAAKAEGEPCVSLRQDGAQRHRILRHAAHCRKLRSYAPRPGHDPGRDRRRVRAVEQDRT